MFLFFSFLFGLALDLVLPLFFTFWRKSCFDFEKARKAHGKIHETWERQIQKVIKKRKKAKRWSRKYAHTYIPRTSSHQILLGGEKGQWATTYQPHHNKRVIGFGVCFYLCLLLKLVSIVEHINRFLSFIRFKSHLILWTTMISFQLSNYHTTVSPAVFRE